MALDSNSAPSTDRSVGLGVITQAQTQSLTSDTQHAGYTLQKIHVLRIRGDLLPLKRSGLCYFSPNMWFPFCTMRLPKFGCFKARISRGWRLRLEPSSPRAVGSLFLFFPPRLTANLGNKTLPSATGPYLAPELLPSVAAGGMRASTRNAIILIYITTDDKNNNAPKKKKKPPQNPNQHT